MMKRYKIGDNYYWYEEGAQPECAVEDTKKETKKPENEVKAEVEVKVSIPKNKSKGVKAK